MTTETVCSSSKVAEAQHSQSLIQCWRLIRTCRQLRNNCTDNRSYDGFTSRQFLPTAAAKQQLTIAYSVSLYTLPVPWLHILNNLLATERRSCKCNSLAQSTTKTWLPVQLFSFITQPASHWALCFSGNLPLFFWLTCLLLLCFCLENKCDDGNNECGIAGNCFEKNRFLGLKTFKKTKVELWSF